MICITKDTGQWQLANGKLILKQILKQIYDLYYQWHWTMATGQWQVDS